MPMAFSKLIWAGLITRGIIVIPVNRDQLWLMSQLGVPAQTGEEEENLKRRDEQGRRKHANEFKRKIQETGRLWCMWNILEQK